MDDLDDVVVRVRADREGFAREVAGMRDALEGALEVGAGRGGRAIEGSLMRAVRTGKLGFDDLKATALRAMDEIAAAAVKAGIGAVLGGAGRGSVAGGIGSLLLGLAGVPGRATGGPVAPGRAYRVGERGPELFVPTATGRVVPNGEGTGGAARDVRVAITVYAGGGHGGGNVGTPEALARSGRQVARAVRAALREE